MSILNFVLGIFFAQTAVTTDNGALAIAQSVTETVRLGRADAAANRVSGRVQTSDGQVAPSAKIRIAGYRDLQVDATVHADQSGKFDFVVRCDAKVLPQLRITATSNDGTQAVFHRFAWEEKDRVTEGIELQLQPLRQSEIEVVDGKGAPVEDAKIAIQLGYPHVLQGIATDRNGRAKFQFPEKERIDAAVAWKDGWGLDYRLYTLNRYQRADLKAVPPEFPKGRPERLVLEGSSPLRVKTIGDAGKPISGVSLYPWILYKGDDREGFNLSFFTDVFSQVTDAHGETTFRWMPNWQTKLLTFWPTAEGYEHPRGNYDPASRTGTLEIKLHRLVPIRGQVKDEEGKAVPGIEVVAQGAGRSHNRFDAWKRTDADGKYELMVAPNQIYIVYVRDPRRVAAAQTGFAALPNQAIDGRDFQLRKPTRVHGRLTNENTQEPIPNERVIVYQYGTHLDELPENTLPNPDGERWRVSPIVQHYNQTNAQGEFEFFLGDGKFDIRPPNQEKADEFTISGEPEVLLSVTTKIKPEVELVGLVVRKDNGQPVAGVRVAGVPRNFSGMDWQATTGDNGKFKVKRNGEPTYIHAISADNSLAGVAEVDDKRMAFLIHLEPTGSARGRVINDAKEPVTNQRIEFGIKVPDVENRTFSYRFGGVVTTDSKGEFELEALVPGREYTLSLPSTSEGSIPTLTKITLKTNERLELGDLLLPVPIKRPAAPTVEGRMQSAFNVVGTPIERHARALELIKLVKQHLLVIFGKPDDPRIVSLFKLRDEDKDYRPFGDEFRFMAIPTDGARAAAAVDLASKLNDKLSESQQPFHLVMLDASGKKVASAGIGELCTGDQLAKDKLFELLRKHLPQPLDARQLYDAALKRAAEEKKMVIIQETATWCGSCHQLSRLLDSNRVWEKDYIWLKMDHRWTGAVELMAKLREGAEGGIPWFAILDSEGKKLATSNDSKTGQNIGYPAEPSGQIHFAAMLNATRNRLTESDVVSLIQAIKSGQK